MRTVAEVLELALAAKFGEFGYAPYMCWHLQHMYGRGEIDVDEYMATKDVVMGSIKGYVTLAGYLRATGAMTQHVSSVSEEFVPYREKFYRELINKLNQVE